MTKVWLHVVSEYQGLPLCRFKYRIVNIQNIQNVEIYIFFQPSFSSCPQNKDAAVQTMCGAIEMVTLESFLQGQQMKDVALSFRGKNNTSKYSENQFQGNHCALINTQDLSLALFELSEVKLNWLVEGY